MKTSCSVLPVPHWLAPRWLARHWLAPRWLAQHTAAIALVAFLVASAEADTIRYRKDSGKPPKSDVTVKSETATEITYVPQGANKERTDEAFDIEIVEYDDAPDDFKRGLSYFNKSSWYDAARFFKNVLTAVEAEQKSLSEEDLPTVRYWWVKQYANYYLGASLRQRGLARHPEEFPNAIARFQEVLDHTPPSRFTGQAMIGMAQCVAAQGEGDKAKESLDKVVAMAREKKIAPHLAAAAFLARAELAAAAGDHAGAATDYRRLAEELQSGEPERATRYFLAAAFQRLEAGDSAGARSDFERLREAPGGAQGGLAQAGANNGLGLIALAAGNAREAREAFARTIANFGSYPSEYERALKGMADAVRALGDKLKGGPALADSYIRELRVRNPRSPLLEGEAETKERRSAEDEE